jgi:anti-anti-sigma factor
VSDASSIAVIKLTGELDANRRLEVQDALTLKGDEPALLLDLFEVTYADSTVLAELLRMREEAQNRGVRVALLIGHRQFVRLLEFAGLAQMFNIFRERGPALKYLARSQ